MSSPATSPGIAGIHHVTAITADAQQNVDFYCGVLGLRLVKLTVNFDDPGSYHLYYGDTTGRPGTILTFFAWPGAHRGRSGPPQVTATAFAVPRGSLDFWAKRLGVGTVSERFGERVIRFADPDGMSLEITEAEFAGASDHDIRGFAGVTISEEGYESTAKLLTDTMGFAFVGSDDNRFRYRAGSGSGFAATVDLLCTPDARRGGLGAGIVHHVAFRTPDDAGQTQLRATVAQLGLNVSPVMDRKYFRSIYFREPGGVLFEIATDGPGFAVDESPENLGTKLMLPDGLEQFRAEIERTVPPLRLPNR